MALMELIQSVNKWLPLIKTAAHEAREPSSRPPPRRRPVEKLEEEDSPTATKIIEGHSTRLFMCIYLIWLFA